jgi:hypothetical protein
VSIGKLILIPSLITLGITILRLVGELQHWSPILFNPAAGGGGALVGITWLPLILGPYFARKLIKSGHGPGGCNRTIGYAVLGLLIFFTGSFVGFAPILRFPGRQAVGYLLMIAALFLQFLCWRPLAHTLLSYAYAARIPVVIIMYFALRDGWGTHYDAMPPEAAVLTGFYSKFLLVGVLPQLIFWIAYTVIVGALVGSIVAAVARRRPAPVSPS